MSIYCIHSNTGDTVLGEPFGLAKDRRVEPSTTLRQAQGERGSEMMGFDIRHTSYSFPKWNIKSDPGSK